MEHKRAIVTTDEGGIPDLVKDGMDAIVCKKQNLEALALALSHLIDDKALRRQMGEAGYKLFKENFTLQKFEERMCGALKACIGL